MQNHSKIYVQVREGIQDLPQSHQAELQSVKLSNQWRALTIYHLLYLRLGSLQTMKSNIATRHCRMAGRTICRTPTKTQVLTLISLYIVQPISKIHCPVILSAIVGVSHLPGHGNAT